MKQLPPAARSGGFTLVEVLVSLMLSAVIFISAYEVIGNLVKYQVRLNSHHRTTADTLLLKNLFTQIIEQSLHVSDLPWQQGKEVYFQGKDDSLRLVSRAYSRNYDEPGYRVYRLFLRDGELMVSHVKYGVPPAQRIVRETATGLRLKRLALSYWVDDRWQSRWQDPRHLPRFIRVDMTLPDGRQLELIRETARR